MVQQISDAELDIMKIIWENEGTALFAFIMEQLSKKGKTWQKNSVITLLSRLMEKKFLKAKKIGRRNEYIALITQAEYQTMQTKNLLNKIYEGDIKGLVSNLVQSELLTPNEYEELKRFWEEGESKKKSF